MKDLSLAPGAEHPVTAAVKALENLLEDGDPIAIVAQSRIIKAECSTDLAHRCLAAKNGAYSCLLRGIEKQQSNKDVLLPLLEAMACLTDGQPDILTDGGVDLLLDILESQKSESEIISVTTLVTKNTCTKHEVNRVTFVSKDLITKLVQALEENKTCAQVVKGVCASLRSLTLDDDIRVPFGKAHENAKLIVTEAGALKKLLDLCDSEFIFHSSIKT